MYKLYTSLQLFLESMEIQIENDIKKFLEEEFDATVKSHITGNTYEFELDICPIEPEHGSYTSRTEATIRIASIDDYFNLSITGMSGQYGSDEDSGFEPEFDYDISSESIRYKKSNIKDIEELKNDIKNTLESYI